MVDGPPVDIPVFNMYVIDIMDKSLDSFEDTRDENSQNEEPKVQVEKNVEVGEDNDIPTTNIIKRIIENVTKSQDNDSRKKAKEVVDMDEETEPDEEPIINVMKNISRFISHRVQDKNKEKYVPHKLPMKDIVTKKDKNPKGNFVTKRRKVESKFFEKKSLI